MRSVDRIRADILPMARGYLEEHRSEMVASVEGRLKRGAVSLLWSVLLDWLPWIIEMALQLAAFWLRSKYGEMCPQILVKIAEEAPPAMAKQFKAGVIVDGGRVGDDPMFGG